MSATHQPEQHRQQSNSSTAVPSDSDREKTTTLKPEQEYPARTSLATATTINDTHGTAVDLVAPNPPPINFDPWKEKRWNIFFYWTFIIFCNLALPCIIYYPIRTLTTLSLRDAIGAGSASLGTSAMFEFPRRLYKVWRYREKYGPLHDDTWWHYDSFMYQYTLAMLIAAVPLAVAPATDPPLTSFFLLFSAILIGSLAVLMVPSLFRFKLPCWMSSDRPGSVIKPQLFYMVEDICAVDCSKGRQFRREWNARYEASPPFRLMIKELNAFWILGGAVYFGISCAVVFTTKVDFAFAFTLGLLYIWGAIWYAITQSWVHIALIREHNWWKKTHGKGMEEGAMRMMSRV